MIQEFVGSWWDALNTVPATGISAAKKVQFVPHVKRAYIPYDSSKVQYFGADAAEAQKKDTVLDYVKAIVTPDMVSALTGKGKPVPSNQMNIPTPLIVGGGIALLAVVLIMSQKG